MSDNLTVGEIRFGPNSYLPNHLNTIVSNSNTCVYESSADNIIPCYKSIKDCINCEKYKNKMVDFDKMLEILRMNDKKIEPGVEHEIANNKEMVNHPLHYNKNKWEVIDVLMEFFKDDPLLFNAGKYIMRCNHKGKPIEDLKKAIWYLEYKIKELEKVI